MKLEWRQTTHRCVDAKKKKIIQAPKKRRKKIKTERERERESEHFIIKTMEKAMCNWLQFNRLIARRTISVLTLIDSTTTTTECRY